MVKPKMFIEHRVFWRVFAGEDGGTAVEYAVVLAIIIFICLVVWC